MLRNMPLPQTIQIYLPQGDPAGIRMAEITTRTVRVFEVPRPLLRDFREMPESKQVGVYFLFGSSSSGVLSCYIGQSGAIGDRLKQHSDKKDFWDHVLVAVSLTNTWTKTHAGYMEWQAIKLATEGRRYELHNANDASNPHTSLGVVGKLTANLSPTAAFPARNSLCVRSIRLHWHAESRNPCRRKGRR